METVLKSEIHEFLANLYEAREPRRSLQGEIFIIFQCYACPRRKTQVRWFNKQFVDSSDVFAEGSVQFPVVVLKEYVQE